MITKHPDLPDYFWVLDPLPSFRAYADAYGDQIAEHYENNGVIVMTVPITFDIGFFQDLTFPPAWKKIGKRGLEQPVLIFKDGRVQTDPSHPLVAASAGNELVGVYIQNQISSFNWQLRLGVQVLFPRYRFRGDEITWRLTPTGPEGLHFDVGDADLEERKVRNRHLVKVFINIDSEPRHWRMSRTLPDAIAALSDALPSSVDLYAVNRSLNASTLLQTMPAHEVRYPAMTAVICNGITVSHEIVSGRRVVGGEFACPTDNMLDPTKHPAHMLPAWIEKARAQAGA